MTTEELLQKVRDELGDNEEAKLYHKFRVRDEGKPYIPDYHFSSPGGYLNDPCGYCYYKGVYHLFYQFCPEQTDKSGWGHAVSVDMIHWIDLPAAVMPTVETECGSGGALVEDDRVILCYQGNMQGKPCGAIHLAESTDDLLINWTRLSKKPIITTYNEDGTRNPYNAFDPYMWKDGDTYFLLSAGGGSLPHDSIDKDERAFRRLYLFCSKNLEDWEYCHEFLENDSFADIGDDGACPYLLDIGNGKHIILHFSHMSGGQYIIGKYDREKKKFYAEKGGAFNRNAWYSGTHAPSAFADSDGTVHAIFNINYGFMRGAENQIMSLPRTFKLDEVGNLLTAPDGDFESLRYDGVSKIDFYVPENVETPLPGVSGKALEIKMTVDTPEKRNDVPIFIPTNNIPVFELRVLASPDGQEYTAVRFFRNRSKMNWDAYVERGIYKSSPPQWADATNSVVEVDTSHSTLSADVAIHPTESQEFYTSPDEPIELHVFVDKSIVEVFAGDKKCISVRTYPTLPDSTGVTVMSRGVGVNISYEAWKMKKNR